MRPHTEFARAFTVGIVAKWSPSLSVKLVLGLNGSLIVISVLLGYRITQLHRHHLEDMAFTAAHRISESIKSSILYSMQQNHRDEIYQSIKTIGRDPGVHRIRIFNPLGRIAFSSVESEINTLVDKRAEACFGCHAQEEPLTRLTRPDRQRIYNDPDNGRVLGLINVIENQPGCPGVACHADVAKQRVLGVLDVGLALSEVDQSALEGQRELLLYLLVAIAGISLTLGLLIWLLDHKPVKRLTLATRRVASGDFHGDIPVFSDDELGELAGSFNHMTAELERAQGQLQQWARTLEARVEERTKELKQAHEQMVQVERMASVGRLAAFVAPEINNPLAGILTAAKLLLKRTGSESTCTEKDRETRVFLEMIAGALQRATTERGHPF